MIAHHVLSFNWKRLDRLHLIPLAARNPSMIVIKCREMGLQFSWLIILITLRSLGIFTINSNAYERNWSIWTFQHNNHNLENYEEEDEMKIFFGFYSSSSIYNRSREPHNETSSLLHQKQYEKERKPLKMLHALHHDFINFVLFLPCSLAYFILRCCSSQS
jgi:hypothetical protein